jgi:hypothetical protein
MAERWMRRALIGAPSSLIVDEVVCGIAGFHLRHAAFWFARASQFFHRFFVSASVKFQQRYQMRHRKSREEDARWGSTLQSPVSECAGSIRHRLVCSPPGRSLRSPLGFPRFQKPDPVSSRLWGEHAGVSFAYDFARTRNPATLGVKRKVNIGGLSWIIFQFLFPQTIACQTWL